MTRYQFLVTYVNAVVQLVTVVNSREQARDLARLHLQNHHRTATADRVTGYAVCPISHGERERAVEFIWPNGLSQLNPARREVL